MGEASVKQRLRDRTRLIGAVLSLWALVAGAAAAQNLVANPSFEAMTADGLPESWQVRRWGPEVPTEVGLTKKAYRGKRALAVTSKTGPVNFGVSCWPLELQPDPPDRLIIGCWYKTAGHPAAQVELVTFRQDFRERGWDTPRLQDVAKLVQGAKDWRHFSWVVDLTPGVRQAVLLLKVAADGTFLVDAVSVRRFPAEVTSSLKALGEVQSFSGKRRIVVAVKNGTEKPVTVRGRFVLRSAKRKPRTWKKSLSLKAAADGELSLEYDLPVEETQQLEYVLTDETGEAVYDRRVVTVPGLFDAEIVSPAFRGTRLPLLGETKVVVRGRVNAAEALASKMDVVASVHGAGPALGEGKVQRLTRVGRQEFTVTLDPGKLLTGEYEVRLQAEVNGKTEATQSLVFRQAPAAPHEFGYGADLLLRRDGKKLFPLMLAGVLIQEDLETAAQTGFNSVLAPYRACYTAYAEEAERLGLGYVVQSDSNVEEFWGRVHEKFGARSGLLGYEIFRRPGQALMSPGLFAPIYELLRRRDPVRPVVAALGSPTYYREYAGDCDILLVESDIVPVAPLQTLAHDLDLAHAAVRGAKPVWASIQSIGTHFSLDRNLPVDGAGRNPTPEEHRCLTFLALVHGANGLVFRSFQTISHRDRPAYLITRDAPRLWQSMGGTNKRLHALEPALTDGLSLGPAKVRGEGVEARVWHHEGRLYIVGVNPTDMFQEASISVPVSGAADWEVLFENRVVHSRAGELRDEFHPYAVHLYRSR